MIDEIYHFYVVGSGVIDDHLIITEHPELIHGIGVMSLPNLPALMVDVNQLLSLFNSAPHSDVDVASVATGEFQNFSRGLLQFNNDCVLQQIHSESKYLIFIARAKYVIINGFINLTKYDQKVYIRYKYEWRK